jgi:hypothetical protein
MFLWMDLGLRSLLHFRTVSSSTFGFAHYSGQLHRHHVPPFAFSISATCAAFSPPSQSLGSTSARRFTTTMVSSASLWLITTMSPWRLADHCRNYYVSDSNGSSPGKVIDFLPSPTSFTHVDYAQDFGFRKSELPHPRHQPSRGLHQVQAGNLSTSSFRSFIGPVLLLFPFRQLNRVSSGTLDFSTRSLLQGPRPNFHRLANHHAGHTPCGSPVAPSPFPAQQIRRNPSGSG